MRDLYLREGEQTGVPVYLEKPPKNQSGGKIGYPGRDALEVNLHRLWRDPNPSSMAPVISSLEQNAPFLTNCLRVF